MMRVGGVIEMLIQEFLRIQRTSRGLTQEQVANKLHVTTQAVSKWESGQTMHSIDNLLMLSDFYNVSIDTLLQGSPFFKKPFIVGKPFNFKKGFIGIILCFGYQSFLSDLILKDGG